MKGNNLNFDSKNLVVDYISLNIQGPINDSINPKSIANYLFQNFNFNSTIFKKINYKWKSESLNYDSQNQFQVAFWQYEYHPEVKSFWEGTKVHFSGTNAAQIYKIIQTKKFDWKIFQPYKLSLSRFDLCYFKEIKIESQVDLELFMNKCCQKTFARSKKYIAEYTRNPRGLILRIGDRKSPNFFRIYQQKNGIRFELEIKNQPLKAVQDSLFMNHIKDFEDKFTRHFYQHSKKVLVLDDLYTDWLIDYSRETNKPIDSLVTSYLETSDFGTLENKKYIFRLLQLVSFSRRYLTNPKIIYSQKYYVIHFRVRDFMDFIQIKNKNHYQLTKTRNFLLDLKQNTPPVTVFSDDYFRSAATIPYVEMVKKRNVWFARVLIAEELYFYKFPFAFPYSFLSYQTDHQLLVKLQIIQAISTHSLEKKFYINYFLSQFNVSKQKQAYIKKLIVQEFNSLQQKSFIENQFQLITKSGITQKVDKLTPLKIGQSKLIIFYENL